MRRKVKYQGTAVVRGTKSPRSTKKTKSIIINPSDVGENPVLLMTTIEPQTKKVDQPLMLKLVKL